MINKYSFVLILIVALLFNSCVSKKKFLEMQSGRLSAEQQVRELTEKSNTQAERIQAMIADYEDMRNVLLENNAIKESYIDSLNTVVFELNNQLSEQKQSLEATSFNLDFEKQRLTDALDNKDRTIKRLQSNIDELENDISSRSSLIDQKNYDISLMEDKIQQVQGQVKMKDTNLEKLQAQLNKVKQQVETLQTQIKEKDESITRLENNVKLLKQELGSGQ
ncbi:MAG TPA: hypothetical protein VKA10_03820 [Prolixibacteraceae bacterium]|nr:hypothetical protein [Prolixibacteraceae bacterium]